MQATVSFGLIFCGMFFNTYEVLRRSAEAGVSGEDGSGWTSCAGIISEDPCNSFIELNRG